jgi:hypothetical protein
MSVNQFLRDLSSTVAGRAERRFARDLARELGFRIEEPSHGTKPKANTQPAPAASMQPNPPISDAFQAGQEHGQAWGFNRAYRTDLQRLVDWVDTVRGEFTVRDVVGVVFPNPTGDWQKYDADRLLAGDEDYARGFVVGGMLVWANQLTKDQNEKEN